MLVVNNESTAFLHYSFFSRFLNALKLYELKFSSSSAVINKLVYNSFRCFPFTAAFARLQHTTRLHYWVNNPHFAPQCALSSLNSSLSLNLHHPRKRISISERFCTRIVHPRSSSILQSLISRKVFLKGTNKWMIEIGELALLKSFVWKLNF